MSKRRPGWGSPTAVIDLAPGEPWPVGDGTKIWHSSHVCHSARVGENCNVGEAVHIGPRVVVGDNCKIQNGAQLFEGVTLEDDVFIGPHVVFTNVTVPRAFINRRAEFKPTLVKHGASIGANATILCGVTIGEYAMIGAGAVVSRDVQPHALMTGVPATHSGWVCRCGVRIDPPGIRCACGTKLDVKESKLYPYNITAVRISDAAAP